MIGRVQKIISNNGFCSRRKAEDFIRCKRVTVNGKLTKIGDSADTSKDRIQIDGRDLREPRKLYYMLNKPLGVETTLKSETGKPTVVQVINLKERVIPAGRLDADTGGLIILTNDGELANRIMHPRYQIGKVYTAKIRGIVPDEKLDILRKGVKLEEFTTSPCEIRVIKRGYDTTFLSITLHEGRKRQIRRMVDTIGFRVLDLVRVRIGPLTLRGVSEGKYRELRKKELKELKKAVKLI
jgi:23S rRNA pseudouridine2605 synthase